MKTQYLLISLLFSPLCYSQTPDSMSYFPHSLDNVWEYYDYWGYPDPDTIKQLIIFDSIDNIGNHFVIRKDSTFGGGKLSKYYRIDTLQNVFECNFEFKSYSYGPLLKLNANQGDIWVYDTIIDANLPYIVGRIDSVFVDNWYGKIDTAKYIEYFLSEDSILSGNFSPLFGFLHLKGIGLVWHWGDGAGVGLVLKGASIQGHLYGSLTVSIDDDQKSLPSKSFILYQNYPNPFNPTTKINYYITRYDRVRLSIFNIVGQKIIDLVDKYQSNGFYEYFWDGKDKKGNYVSSGIYIYTLQVGNQKMSRKMTLVK